MKKIFTLIAAALMAAGVQAQTEVALGGLTASSFSYDEADFTASSGSDDNGTYESFDYIKQDKTNWSYVSVKDSPVQFGYKNSGTKSGIFRMYAENFYTNGKQTRIKITGLTEGQTVTLNACGKNDNGAKFVVVSNCEADASNPTTAIGKDDWTDVKFTATGDGDIEIEENNAGYKLKKITIAAGSGEVVISDPTTPVQWDFSVISDTDASNMAADANWGENSDGTRWLYNVDYESSEARQNDIVLMANGVELEVTKGLLFGRDGSIPAGKIVFIKEKSLNFGGGKYRVIIPNLVKDDVVKVKYGTSTTGEERGFTVTNAVAAEGSALTTDDVAEATLTVTGKGSVVLESTGAINIFYITVNKDFEEAVPPTPEPLSVDIPLANFKDAVEDGSIYTIDATAQAWGWFNVWYGVETAFDASAYDYFVIELASAHEFTVQGMVEYANGAASTSGQAQPGELLAKTPLNPEGKAGVTQAAIQNGATGKVKVQRAFYCNEAYLATYEAVPAGISTVKAEVSGDGILYNLAGQRVNESYRGVVIQNGRKFVK